MKGFLKIKASEFDAWNNQATVDYIAATGDDSCDEYTSSTPDVDPEHVWARVEHDFVEGDIKTRDEAIEAGMVIDTEENGND